MELGFHFHFQLTGFGLRLHAGEDIESPDLALAADFGHFGHLALLRSADHTPAVVSFYFFLLGVGAIGAAAYLLLFFSHVPGAREERFGTFTELPKNLGKWLKAREPNKEGLIRERRRLMEEGSGGERIIVQVRYRDPKTNKIVRILPEKIVRRARIRTN